MPASPKKRRAPVAPRRRSPARPKPAPARPTALTDATGDIGDLFEETILELLARDDGRGWKSGPAIALPMAQMEAGHLGWSATLSAPGASVVGTLTLLVVPGRSTRPPKELPLHDAAWAEFDSVDHLPGPPRLLLLARARTPTARSGIREFTHTLFAELRTELSAARPRRPRAA